MASKTLSVIIAGDAKGLTSATSKASGSLGKLGKVGMVAGAALAGSMVAAGVGIFKVGESFDKAFDTIRVGTGATGKDLKGLEGDFKEVVKNVPTDFESASAAIADLNTRTGQSGPALQKLSEQMLEVTRLTGGDLSGNIAAVTRVFGDWSIATEDQSKAADYLFKVSQSTGISLDSLSRTVSDYGAPLRQFGFSFEKSAAIMGKWEKEGVNSQAILAGLKQGLGKLAKAGREPVQALKDVQEKIKSAGDAGAANAAAIEVFGTRAGPDLAAAVREGRFEVDDLVQSLEDSPETIMKASKATESFGEKWQKIKNRVLVALEPLATKVFGAVGDAMDKIGPVITKVSAWFSSLFSSFSTDSAGAGQVFDSFGKIIKSVIEAAKPIIATLGQVIHEKIVPAFLSIFKVWKENVIPVLEKLGKLITEKVLPTFKDIAQFVIEKLVPIIVQLWEKLYKALMPAFKALAEMIINVLGKAFEVMRKFFNDHKSQIETVFKVLATLIEWFGKIVAFIIRHLAPVFEKVLVVAIKAIMWILDKLVDSFGTVMKVFGEVGKFFITVAQQALKVFKGIGDGFLTMIIFMLNAASHLPFVGGRFGKLRDDVKDFKGSFDKSMGGAVNTMDDAKDKINAAVDGIKSKKEINISAKGYIEDFSQSNGASGVEWAKLFSASLNADGNIYENHQAQIAPGGAMRVWAEPETGGEAYIPLASSKRQRSLSIWEKTGQLLGATEAPSGVNKRYYADGGIDGFAGGITDMADRMSVKVAKGLGSVWVQAVKQLSQIGALPAGGIGVDRILALAATSGFDFRVNSAYRPGEGSYHGQGRAVDFGSSDMQGFATWWFTHYGKSLLELIHADGFQHNVKNGQDVGDGYAFYGAATMAQHGGSNSHVHVALREGGVLNRASRSLVGEGGPEVLDLPRNARVTPLDGIGGNITVNITVQGSVTSERQLVKTVQDGIADDLRRKGKDSRYIK